MGVLGILMSLVNISIAERLSLLDAYKRLNNSVTYLSHPISANLYLFLGLFSAGVVMLFITSSSEIANKFPIVRRLLVLAGDNSYEFYLFHWPILVAVKNIFKGYIPKYYHPYFYGPVTLMFAILCVYLFAVIAKTFRRGKHAKHVPSTD